MERNYINKRVEVEQGGNNALSSPIVLAPKRGTVNTTQPTVEGIIRRRLAEDPPLPIEEATRRK